MSVVNVKFSYAGQPASEVHQIYRAVPTTSIYEYVPAPKPEPTIVPIVPKPPTPPHVPAPVQIEELIFHSGNIATTPVFPIVPIVEEAPKPKPAQITRVKSFEALPATPKAEQKSHDPPKPFLKIEEVNETEFTKIVAPKKQKLENKQTNEIVLKAPSFKFTPKQQGDITRKTQKQYVRAENAEKYLYNGIPEKSEDDFVGCFGCMRKKPKAYSIDKNRK